MEEKTVGVYVEEDCSIPSGTGKFSPVWTSRDIVVEASDRTIPGLILLEIV